MKFLKILPHVSTIYNANRNMLLALFNVSPDGNEEQNDTFQALFVIRSFMIPSLHTDCGVISKCDQRWTSTRSLV